jgi:hypothetical protein
MSLSEEDLTAIVSRVVAELQDPQPTPQAVDHTHFQVVTGQVIAADHINSLANQSVPKYPTSGALTADWPAPPVGSMAYIQDTNILVVYDNQITGGANTWRPVGGLRMGYALMGGGQVISNDSFTLIKRGTIGGAAGKPGRGTWNTDGSVTVPVSGTYLVSGSISWPSNATGQRRLYIRRQIGSTWTPNGTAGGSAEINVAGTSQLNQSVTAMVAALAGEKVGLHCSQTSGTSLTLPTEASGYAARLAVHLLGAD